MKPLSVNDIVSVNFHAAQITLCHRAKILFLRANLEDSWVLECLDTGSLYYVSEPCTLTRLKLGSKDVDG
jgi:hypothetical protein